MMQMNDEHKTPPLLFSMLRNPRLTGAVAPSSKRLAELMAKTVQGADLIVELGAGTGAITKALIEYYPGTPIISVEYQAQLAEELRHTFPGLDVRQNTAKAVLDEVPAGEQKIAVVSSLPFRSLPDNVKNETVRSILNLFERSPSTTLVQFTYGLTVPFELLDENKNSMRWQMRNTVWRNIPPARVWKLEYR